MAPMWREDFKNDLEEIIKSTHSLIQSSAQAATDRMTYINKLKRLRGKIVDLDQQSLQRYKQLRSGLIDLNQQLVAAFDPAAIK